MKTFICMISIAILMATTAVAGNTNPSKNPGDGNSKINTTIRCGKEKGAHPKTYPTKTTVKKNFTKKHYRHMKKR